MTKDVTSGKRGDNGGEEVFKKHKEERPETNNPTTMSDEQGKSQDH